MADYVLDAKLKSELEEAVKRVNRIANQVGVVTGEQLDRIAQRGSLVAKPPTGGINDQTATKPGEGECQVFRWNNQTSELAEIKKGDGTTSHRPKVLSLPVDYFEAHWTQQGRLCATAPGTFVAKVTTTISAASYDSSSGELSLGSGMVQPYGRDSGGDFSAVSGASVLVYNWTTVASGNPASQHTWVQILRNQVDGCLYYAGESCSPIAV